MEAVTEPQEEGLKITIAGVEYELPIDSTKYDLKEGRVLRELTGLYLSDLEDGLRLDDPAFITFLVWAAMHRKDPTVTVQKVERLSLMSLITQLQQAFENAAPPEKKEPDAGPPALAAEASSPEEPGEATEPELPDPPGPPPASADASETNSEPSPETPPATSGPSG